ncbi:MAG: flagellar filament capping protein FliD [Proteobacteria bacterium]|nr:flagellar filament capping protein FliD [Pseudomonadota bacterium]
MNTNVFVTTTPNPSWMQIYSNQFHQPFQSLSSIQASYKTEISSISQILSSLDSLNTAAFSLGSSAAFSLTSVFLENSNLATAQAGSDALPGTFSLNINQLANHQTLSTESVTSSNNTIGSNSTSALIFTFGSIINGQFIPDMARASQSVIIQPPDNNFKDIASHINAANIGLTASITSDASGQQLIISGESGASNAFSIKVSGDSDLASLLTYIPGNLMSLMPLSQAQDASITINGVTKTSSNNNFNYALPYLNLTLNSTGKTSLTIMRKPNQSVSAIEQFINQYNNSIKTLNTALSGPLAGNSYIESLQSNLTTTISEINPNLFRSIGITTNFDGTLNLNITKLSQALTLNSQKVASIFTSPDNGGIANQILKLTNNINSSISGLNLIIQGMEQAQQGALSFEKNMLANINSSFNWMSIQYNTLNQLLTTLSNSITNITISTKQLSQPAETHN